MRLSRGCLGLTTILLLSALPLGCIVTINDGDEGTSESSADGDASSDADGSSSGESTSSSGSGDGDESSGEGDTGDGDTGDGDSSTSTGDGDTGGDGDGGDGDTDAGDGDSTSSSDSGDGDSGDGDTSTGDGDTSAGDGDAGDGDTSGGDGDGDMACADLTGVSFGDCDAVLGWAVYGESCETVSGCEISAGYESAVYATLEACQTGCPITCGDLSGVDLGPCDAIIGWGVIGGACTELSGCQAPEGYEPQVHESQQACVAACGSDGCTDLAGEDFGPCAAILGYGVVNGTCAAISGCSLPTAYEGDVYSTMGECTAAC